MISYQCPFCWNNVVGERCMWCGKTIEQAELAMAHLHQVRLRHEQEQRAARERRRRGLGGGSVLG